MAKLTILDPSKRLVRPKTNLGSNETLVCYPQTQRVLAKITTTGLSFINQNGNEEKIVRLFKEERSFSDKLKNPKDSFRIERIEFDFVPYVEEGKKLVENIVDDGSGTPVKVHQSFIPSQEMIDFIKALFFAYIRLQIRRAESLQFNSTLLNCINNPYMDVIQKGITDLEFELTVDPNLNIPVADCLQIIKSSHGALGVLSDDSIIQKAYTMIEKIVPSFMFYLDVKLHGWHKQKKD